MAWRKRRGSGSDSNGECDSNGEQARPELDASSDTEVLMLVAERLTALTGRPWRVHGSQVTGPPRCAVTLAEPHPGDPGARDDGHLDLRFVLDTGHPASGVIDCVVGLGATATERIQRAVDVWARTTVPTLLDLLFPQEGHATYLGPHDPRGLAGWHSIHGHVIGWGSAGQDTLVRDWTIEHAVLPALAPALTSSAFDRDTLVGLKVFLGSHDGAEQAEVRIDGRAHPAASAALGRLDWPRTPEGASFARTFVLLVQPA